MNIAFFLTPKNEVVFLNNGMTMRQAMEKMEYHRYTAVPIIDEDGKYCCTLTEGDLLWYLKHHPKSTFWDTSHIMLDEIPKNRTINAVSINADINNLISLMSAQNFVPVVDDDNIFIGIIKRSDVIQYCYNAINKREIKVV